MKLEKNLEFSQWKAYTCTVRLHETEKSREPFTAIQGIEPGLPSNYH